MSLLEPVQMTKVYVSISVRTGSELDSIHVRATVAESPETVYSSPASGLEMETSASTVLDKNRIGVRKSELRSIIVSSYVIWWCGGVVVVSW